MVVEQEVGHLARYSFVAVHLHLVGLGPFWTTCICNISTMEEEQGKGKRKFSTFSAHFRRGGIHPLSIFKSIDISRSHSGGKT